MTTESDLCQCGHTRVEHGLGVHCNHCSCTAFTLQPINRTETFDDKTDVHNSVTPRDTPLALKAVGIEVGSAEVYRIVFELAGAYARLTELQRNQIAAYLPFERLSMLLDIVKRGIDRLVP